MNQREFNTFFQNDTVTGPDIRWWTKLWAKMRGKFIGERKVLFNEEMVKEKGQGFWYRGQEFVHHSDLPEEESAFQQLTGKQILVLGCLLGLMVLGLLVNWRVTLITLISLLTVYYLADMVFNLFLIYRSLSKQVEIQVSEEEIKAVKDEDWLRYTILCPLYKEWQVVLQFVAGIQQLDYPKDKLQVLLLLEEDDLQTIRKVGEFELPNYFEVVVVPHSLPKTKPKACNYGLNKANGEYVVIYDAEDWPEVLQLKKAVLAFQKSDPQTVCIQGKLNYYNPVQNVLTRLFTAEYSLWFDLILPGLQSINAPIPLGGTSNHFRTNQLKDLHRWDAFNVTEDCDLGLRLVKRGYLTAILDSTTWEEANSKLFNWYRQRTRWVKGYIQTYFVHLRKRKAKSEKLKASNEQLIDENRETESIGGWSWLNLWFFQLTVGGKVLSMMVNPFLWLMTISYFAFRPIIGETIESLYLAPILYLGVFSLVFGNFSYLYAYMIGCAKRQQWELMKYVYLVPLYWLGMSVAAWRAAFEEIIYPYYWAKTKHGLHLAEEEVEDTGLAEPDWGPEILPQPAVPAWASVAGDEPMGLANGRQRGSWSWGEWAIKDWLPRRITWESSAKALLKRVKQNLAVKPKEELLRKYQMTPNIIYQRID